MTIFPPLALYFHGSLIAFPPILTILPTPTPRIFSLAHSLHSVFLFFSASFASHQAFTLGARKRMAYFLVGGSSLFLAS